jgi:hypothetical protein
MLTPESLPESSQQRELQLLKQEVAHLRSVVDVLLPLVNADEAQAALELRNLTPSAEMLKTWALYSDPPAEFLEAEEERPW